MIKAVLLDIDNTILDFNECSKQAMEMAFLGNGLPFEEEYAKTFRKINDGLWLRIESGEITREYLHSERFNLILKELSLEGNGRKIEKDFLENLNVCTTFVEGGLELVKYLSGKYILCSASNAPYAQQMARLKNSKVIEYLTHTFISEEMGANKPEKRYFDLCFERMKNIKKEETIMIGDSLSADIIGAKNYGLKCIWFNYAKIKPKGDEADYIVDKLSEIKKIL